MPSNNMDYSQCSRSDQIPCGTNQAFLFQTASRLPLDYCMLDLPAGAGAWDKRSRPKSYSRPPSGVSWNRVFLSKRTKKLVIVLPDGPLIEGR